MAYTKTAIGALLFATLTALVAPAHSSAADRLPDGTLVRLRLLQPINSETSAAGLPLDFVVQQDVVVDGNVVITRGTRAAGTLVESKRLRLKFTGDHKPALVIQVHSTLAADGTVVGLRSSRLKGAPNWLEIDRNRRHHQMQWAGEADVFEVYVDVDGGGQ